MALPPLTAAQIMLLLDRYLGAHFFDTQAGGSAVLWQHFFWLFGHPEVYILMLPGFACASEIIPVFSRKPIFGRAAMIGATVAIGMVSVACMGSPHVCRRHGAVEHLLCGLNDAGGVPTGIKIFNWLARCMAARSGSIRRCCFASRSCSSF
jgi:cytochrome c oxidase subunit 1